MITTRYGLADGTTLAVTRPEPGDMPRNGEELIQREPLPSAMLDGKPISWGMAQVVLATDKPMSAPLFAGEVEWLANQVMDLLTPSDYTDGRLRENLDLDTYAGMLDLVAARTSRGNLLRLRRVDRMRTEVYRRDTGRKDWG